MPKFHVSNDGVPRPCSAQSPESCPVKGDSGESVPHGDFSSLQEAQRFAEKVNASKYTSIGGLSKTSSRVDAARKKRLVEIQESIALIKEDAAESGSMAAQMDAEEEIAALREEERNLRNPAPKPEKQPEQPVIPKMGHGIETLNSRLIQLSQQVNNLTEWGSGETDMEAHMEAEEQILDAKAEIRELRRIEDLIERGERAEYIASIDFKHFGKGQAGSKFLDPRVGDVEGLMMLANRQRGGLGGDDREALIAAGANPKDFANPATGIRYLKVEVKGHQQLRSTASMAETDVLEVRAKGGNDGKPASLTFAAPGSADEVTFGTIVIGPKLDGDKKPIAGTETLYTAHPGVPTRGIRSDDVRSAGLDGGSKLTVGEFRKLFGRDIQVNSF